MSSQPAKLRRVDWDHLILGYLDGSLPDAQVAQVIELCADPAFQRLLAEHALDQAVMYETVGRVEALEPPRLRRFQFSRAWQAVAAALLIGLTVAAVQIATRPSPNPLSGPATIRRLIGDVFVAGQPAAINQSLIDGQLIKTLGFASFACLSFADGTELELSGNTTIACHEADGSKRVEVIDGRLSASVAPQPKNRPLIIKTNAAEMRVVGTNLAVTAIDGQTRLNVATGSVKMRRQRDGEEVMVRKGEFAVAGVDEALSARRTLPAPGVWEADFSEGPSNSWSRGQRLPSTEESPQGAVLAAFADDDDMWVALTKNAWSEGLFRVEDDTYLNYRVKMARPEWYQVLIFVRDDLFQAPGGQPYHEFQELIDFSQLKPNEWHTVSVPLSKFRLTQRALDESYRSRPIDPPPSGATVFRFLFSTQKEDRGLVIDKAWVTRAVGQSPTRRPPRRSEGLKGAAAESAIQPPANTNLVSIERAATI